MSRFNVGDKVIWRYAPHEVTTVVEMKSGPVCGILSASDTNSHWVGDDELRFPNEEATYATGGYTGGYTGNGGAHIEKGYVIPNVDIEVIRKSIKRLSEPAEKQLVDYPIHDAVNHPKHYVSHPSGIECVQVTEHMGFCLGNALKYIWRADLKNDAIEDLRKAIWYIEREIALRERSTENNQQTKEN